MRGYRLDIWESRTEEWHSLHRRKGNYAIGEERLPFNTEDEEGFFQLAAAQPAPARRPATRTSTSTRSIARWAGWSSERPLPGQGAEPLRRSRQGHPARRRRSGISHRRTDHAFQGARDVQGVPGSLPRLRFGPRYRMRARAVDLAGNSFELDDALADTLALVDGTAARSRRRVVSALRARGAPLVVIRDQAAVTGPGSAVDRLVMRTFNDGIDKDARGGRPVRQRPAHRAAAHQRGDGRADGHVRRTRRQAQGRCGDVEPGGGARRRASSRPTPSRSRARRRERADRAGRVGGCAAVSARPALARSRDPRSAGQRQRHGRPRGTATIPPPAPSPTRRLPTSTRVLARRR